MEIKSHKFAKSTFLRRDNIHVGHRGPKRTVCNEKSSVKVRRIRVDENKLKKIKTQIKTFVQNLANKEYEFKSSLRGICRLTDRTKINKQFSKSFL